MPDGINYDAFSEALNDKTDRDLQNVDNTAGADAVIEYQAPDPNNDYKWYRKYKSGWVEQGGITPNVNSSGGTTVALLVEMTDTNYIVIATANELTDQASAKITVALKTTTNFKFNIDGTRNVAWEAKGFAAA